jgi:hypothetical protein
LEQIRAIAVDRFIDDTDEYGFNPYDNMSCLKAVIRAMLALEEFHIVINLIECWRTYQLSTRNGPVEILFFLFF